MTRIAISVLCLLCVACGQASQTKAKTIVPGAGPRGVDMNTDIAVVVNPPVDFKCSFQGGGKKAFVIYRLVSDQWKPMMSCNNGSASDVLGRLVAEDPAPRRLITGWYEIDEEQGPQRQGDRKSTRLNSSH